MRPVRPGFLKNIFPPAAAGGGPGDGVDNLLLESGDDLLMEDGTSVFLLE